MSNPQAPGIMRVKTESFHPSLTSCCIPSTVPGSIGTELIRPGPCLGGRSRSHGRIETEINRFETRQKEDSAKHWCHGRWEGVTMPGGREVLPEEMATFAMGLTG